MAGEAGRHTDGIVAGLHSLIWGQTDPRVRATWRVVLAVPIFWILAGGVLTGNLQSAIGWIPDGGESLGGLAQSLLHGGFFLGLLAVWARYVERVPVSDFGVSASMTWVRDLLIGGLAVVIGFLFWVALGGVLGDASIGVSLDRSPSALLLGQATVVLAVGLHAAVQQILFFRIVLENAIDGLTARGAPSKVVAPVAIAVAVFLFISIHGLSSALRVVDLAVGGTIFGLLYLHTRNLGLGIGVHTGALYGGSILFVPNGPILDVSLTLPGVLGTVSQYGFPRMAVAYLVILAWLRWRGSVSIRTDVTDRSPG